MTDGKRRGKMQKRYGEVSEWFKELVLKTSDSARGHGFESHPLRQRSRLPSGSLLFCGGNSETMAPFVIPERLPRKRRASGDIAPDRAEGAVMGSNPILSAKGNACPQGRAFFWKCAGFELRGRLARCRGHLATRGGLRRSAGRIPYLSISLFHY